MKVKSVNLYLIRLSALMELFKTSTLHLNACVPEHESPNDVSTPVELTNWSNKDGGLFPGSNLLDYLLLRSDKTERLL